MSSEVKKKKEIRLFSFSYEVLVDCLELLKHNWFMSFAVSVCDPSEPLQKLKKQKPKMISFHQT